MSDNYYDPIEYDDEEKIENDDFEEPTINELTDREYNYYAQCHYDATHGN